VRLDPYHLALADELNRTHNVMLPYRNNETHITMLRNRRIGFQQHTANAYVIADRLKPRNCVAERKLHLDRIAYRETTVLAFLLIRWPANVVGFSHNLCCFRWADLYVDTALTPPLEYEGAVSERTIGWSCTSGTNLSFRGVIAWGDSTPQAHSRQHSRRYSRSGSGAFAGGPPCDQLAPEHLLFHWVGLQVQRG
jgi:hypothetical protein